MRSYLISSLCIKGVILAAGASRRFGDANKLLTDVDGRPLVWRSVSVLQAAGLDVTVVVRPETRDEVTRKLPDSGCRVLVNPAAEHGMGTSIAVAAADAARDEDVDGLLILPGDMPHMIAPFIVVLCTRFRLHGGTSIIYPSDLAGRQRNPVVWPRAMFAELAKLDGDRGGKDLIAAHHANAHAVPAADDNIFGDIDTPDDIKSLEAT